MNNLIFNGQSLNEKGFAIKTYPKYKIAERDINFETITGLSGDVITDNKRFKNVEMTYEINSIPYLTPFENALDIIRDFANWLTSYDGQYKILRDDYNKGYFCKAICTSMGDFSNILSHYIDTVLTFNREPYWYSDKGQETIILTNKKNTFDIYNPELFTSEPLIKIYGTGKLKLTINGIVYGIEIPSTGHIELDTELQSALCGTTNGNKYVSFDYMPIFISGNNIIQIAGGGSSSASFEKMEIIPRWRRL